MKPFDWYEVPKNLKLLIGHKLEIYFWCEHYENFTKVRTMQMKRNAITRFVIYYSNHKMYALFILFNEIKRKTEAKIG